MGFSKIQQKNLNSLGEKLKTIRMDKGLTLKELGHLIDKDHNLLVVLKWGKLIQLIYTYWKFVKGWKLIFQSCLIKKN